MLTRMRVSGFKNLWNVDLRFGPFTCIAGPNGVGKSNLFDAILFLSDLSSMPIVKAAGRARGTNGRASDFVSLFAREKSLTSDLMEFVAEMIVPGEVVDDFDRSARPTATLIEYSLTLRLNRDNGETLGKDPIYIEKEELRAQPSSESDRLLEFPQRKQLPKRFIFGPGKRTTPFIATDQETEPVLLLYGEGGVGGRPTKVPARRSPQTVLSGVNSASHPTALAVRREMQSWRLLQLEPTALRRPDDFASEAQISAVGEHIPNTLVRLGKSAQVASRLAELIPGVMSVEVDSDEVRQQRTVQVTMKGKQRYSASSLSDGTLRFLALSVLASDPRATGLVCMEEPENGIHPSRIPEMLNLVRSLSDADFDAEDWIDRGGIRQVIINTHSPLVVAELPEDELLMAETLRLKGATFINFKPLIGTWRATPTSAASSGTITKGELQRYLDGLSRAAGHTVVKRVRDHLSGDLFHAG
jgi:predicted ATPase